MGNGRIVMGKYSGKLLCLSKQKKRNENKQTKNHQNQNI